VTPRCAWLALAALALSCSDSSLRIRVIFPDAASRASSARLLLMAVDPSLPAAGAPLPASSALGCPSVVG
jgi:hypothetical protein